MVRLYLDGGLAYAVVCLCPDSEKVHVRFGHFAVYQFYLKRRRLKANIKLQLMMYLEANALMSAVYFEMHLKNQEDVWMDRRMAR